MNAFIPAIVVPQELLFYVPIIDIDIYIGCPLDEVSLADLNL
jgi:hypothetical protein